MKTNRLYQPLFFLAVAAALACNLLLPRVAATVGYPIDGLFARLFCALACLALLRGLGRRVLCPEEIALSRPTPLSRLTVAAAFLIALNNLPWLGLLTGSVRLTAETAVILLFALDGLAIGLFEELFFRALLLPLALRRFSDRRGGRFLAVLLTSALFGLVHLANLFVGAGVLPTLLQVGYSFLIGGLMAALFFASRNLLAPVLCHALYDFCGRLIPTCGEGELWDTPTVVLTVVLSLAVGALVLLYLYKIARKEN